jgi:hypothetical protein
VALTKTEKTKRYRERHPDAHAKQNRAWYAKHPDNAKKANAASKAWIAAHPEEYKAWNVAYYTKHKDAIQARTKQHAVTKREKEAGCKKPKRCKVCGKAGKICFDHCHKTKKFRGWLCSHCNWALGHTKDNPKLLRKLADYVELHKVLHKKRKEYADG